MGPFTSKYGPISTGWETLDHVLSGGFYRGEVEVFSAKPGAGKSVFLANLAANWALSGLNVVYLTLEQLEEGVSELIGTLLTDLPTKGVGVQSDDAEVTVKYLPSGKTANDIRSYLNEYEANSGMKVDVLIIDYLDLLMPSSSKSDGTLHMHTKLVSAELRILAIEKQCICVTANNVSRLGAVQKIETADNVFGILTSSQMREQGKYQLQLMQSRHSPNVDRTIELDFNMDTLVLTDPHEPDYSLQSFDYSTIPKSSGTRMVWKSTNVWE
jgi:archaellum biogenesis ATPase FlaH